MRDPKRPAALLLCICLLTGLLSGCRKDPEKQGGETTSASTTEAAVTVTEEATVPTTTEAPADYAADYLAALAALDAEPALTVVTELAQTVTLDDEPITETQTETVQYQNRGGEDLIVASDRSVKLGANTYSLAQTYSAETLYSQIGNNKFRASETAECFLSQQTPIALLDPANYESVEQEEGVIRFTGALSAESWAMPEGAELVEAKGSATLENGVLTAQTYQITFLYAGTKIARSCASTLRAGTDEELSARIPVEDDAPVELQSTEALLILLRAENCLNHLYTVSFDISSTDVSQAANFILSRQEHSYHYGKSSDMIWSSKLSGKGYNMLGIEKESFGLEESVVDGVYTYQEDGEEAETSELSAFERIATLRSVLQGMRAEVAEMIPAPTDLTSATVYDVGDFYLVEFTCGENFGRIMDQRTNYDLFQDEKKLMDLAEAYEIDTLEGYLAVEKHTWLPTSVGVNYSAAHTIEGTDYMIALEQQIGIRIGDPEIFYDITDKPLPDIEPEEKATPVFYEVTDENGAKLWLFGTIHIGEDRTAYLPQAIYDAFDAADALAVEFDDAAFEEQIENDPELLQKVAEAYYYTDKTQISDHLEEDVYDAAVRFMKIIGQYNTQAEYLRPFVWGNAIENFYRAQGRRLTPSKGADHRLMDRARAQEKEILNVESGEAQVGMMAGYSDKLQQLLLEEAMGTTRTEYLDGINELYELWCGGDEAALIERLAAADEEELSELTDEEKELYEEYHSAMETSRNADMLEVAKGYLDSGKTVFFAVGLAHLLGDGGLVQALRDAGYTVTLIQN